MNNIQKRIIELTKLKKEHTDNMVLVSARLQNEFNQENLNLVKSVVDILLNIEGELKRIASPRKAYLENKILNLEKLIIQKTGNVYSADSDKEKIKMYHLRVLRSQTYEMKKPFQKLVIKKYMERNGLAA